jgi:hypothetical protein
MKCIKCNNEHDGFFGSGKYCSRSCANSRVFSDEAKLKKSLANKGNVSWNKGSVYTTVEWVISKCQYCGNDIKHRKTQAKQYHAECWKKASGGYRKGAGIGKSGWYNGIWCDSSYELAWVIYQFEHNIPFERNKERFSYEWKGTTKEYIPDFIRYSEIIEIKGYVNGQVKAKLQSVPNLKILFREDLNIEFEYVENKYGKDFIKLYEGNPYKKLTGKCKLCGSLCKEKSVYCSRKCAGAGNNRNNKLRQTIHQTP